MDDPSGMRPSGVVVGGGQVSGQPVDGVLIGDGGRWGLRGGFLAWLLGERVRHVRHHDQVDVAGAVVGAGQGSMQLLRGLEEALAVVVGTDHQTHGGLPRAGEVLGAGGEIQPVRGTARNGTPAAVPVTEARVGDIATSSSWTASSLLYDVQ